MNRAQQCRRQPGHRSRGFFSYFHSIFQKYADRDFFFTGRTAAYFFFFALLFTLTAFADTSASDMYVNVQAAWYEDSYHITNPDDGECLRGGSDAGDRGRYEWVLDETDRC